LRAKSVGSKRKFAIHPEQIETLNDGFSPSTQEVAHGV
jgi:citrate lyase beta subunit